MSDWTSAAAYYLGWFVALTCLFVPIPAVIFLMRTRWFRERRRVHYAGEKPIWWRDTMDHLPPPFGDWPPARRRRRH